MFQVGGREEFYIIHHQVDQPLMKVAVEHSKFTFVFGTSVSCWPCTSQRDSVCTLQTRGYCKNCATRSCDDSESHRTPTTTLKKAIFDFVLAVYSLIGLQIQIVSPVLVLITESITYDTSWKLSMEKAKQPGSHGFLYTPVS